MQNKLQGWKTNLLSMAGRVVIAQAILSAILVYMMQECMLLTCILNNLDKVSKNLCGDRWKIIKNYTWLAGEKLLNRSAEGVWAFRKQEEEI